MKNIVIGTAGHVDHGKTALIKALTGIDTDRLKEEKKRGITIELGFAHLPLPNGETAGIVDVPGHEKFIKNMLAGAGGIDLALLVVAADDGVMPQTKEHLGILGLLGIADGVIAVTKCDLADPEWIKLVEDDIRQEVAGTFLEAAPIVRVSAFTGQGLTELKAVLAERAESVAQKSEAASFRVPVDRVFSVEGFGAVITGTMIEGLLRDGDEVEVYPSGKRARVRNLQVHSNDVDCARAGQRVAVNLAGIRRDELCRGDVLAAPGSMKNTMMLDVKLRVLRDSGRVIANGSRLHIYLGSREALCKLALLDHDALGPGQEGYAQLRFTEELAAKKGDRFVARFYSPIETVGGGVVLDANPPRRRRGQEKALRALEVRERGSGGELLLQVIHENSQYLIPLEEIGRRLSIGTEALQSGLSALEAGGKVVLLDNSHAVSAEWLDGLRGRLEELLGDYHRENPLQAGMRKDELRNRLLPGRDPAVAEKVLLHFGRAGAISLDNQKAALAGFRVQYGEGERQMAEKLEAMFRDAGMAPPGPDELAAAFPKEKALKKLMEAMQAEGVLLAVGPQIYFHREAMARAQESLTKYIAENGQITLAQFRDISGTSRKFALALLEYLDRHGVTKKIGDARVLARR